MSGGGYRVNLEQMDTLITTLQQAKERMTNANNALKNSSASDMGSRDIDSAYGEFQERWEYGIGKVAEFSGTVAEGLAKARQVYADMEQKVTETLGKAAWSSRAARAGAAACGRRSTTGWTGGKHEPGPHR